MGCAMAKTFNPLAYSKKLKEAGFTETQAEVLANAQTEIIDETLVTKEYLDHRLSEVELRMTIRLGAICASAIAIVAAIVKLIS